MECILPSEAARLVLGYLYNQDHCLAIAGAFLENSVHLVECRKLALSTRFIQTEIHGYSLDELLDEFCLMNTLIIEAAEVKNIRQSPASKLSDKLKALLVNHNESSVFCDGSHRKRKRGRIEFPMPGGNDTSQDSLLLQNIENSGISQSGGSQLAKQVSSKLPSPDNYGTGSKARCPSATGKMRNGNGSTHDKVLHIRTDGAISSDTILNFPEIFSQALDSKSLHESLSNSISKALHMSLTSSINKALEQDPPPEHDAVPAPDSELYSAARNVVNGTQNDTCPELFPEGIIGKVEIESANNSCPPSPQPCTLPEPESIEPDPLSPQPPLLKRPGARQGQRGTGIKSRLRGRLVTRTDTVQVETDEQGSTSETQAQAPLVQAPLVQASLVQDPLAQAPLDKVPLAQAPQQAMSNTVALTATSMSRFTILPSLEPLCGGQPSSADTSAIQTVIMGGFENFGAAVPGFPTVVLKRWKMTADGYVNILPKPRSGSQPASREMPPEASPEEAPKSQQRNRSPRGRKAKEGVWSANVEKPDYMEKPAKLRKPHKMRKPAKTIKPATAPQKLSTITVMPHTPNLPSMNTPVPSMPNRNLGLPPAQPPNIAQLPIAQPPIIAQPTAASTSSIKTYTTG